VVQRCERVTLPPIEGGRLDEFLLFRFERAGKDLREIIDESGIQAVAARLSQTGRRGGRDELVSLLYPLAIGNLVIAAMNLAAELGVPVVNADIVKGV
ncbi:MAG: AAA family ATPase, partial [Pseudomonas sp.]